MSQAVPFHVINEAEVGITECGRPTHPPAPGAAMWGDHEVIRLSNGDLAGFPSAVPPKGSALCMDCWRAYEGGVPCVGVDCTCDPDGPFDSESGR